MPPRIWRSGALVLVALLAACSQEVPCPATDEADEGQVWVATRVNVDGVQQLDHQVERAYFEQATSYVIETSHQWPWAANSVRTASWASVADFERDTAASEKPPPGVDAVLYDPEVWASTPASEQRDPAAAMERFAERGHQLGLEVVLTPGLALPGAADAVCAKTAQETHAQAYLRCDIAGSAARYADIVEVQAQSLQSDPEAYRAFVAEAAAQARAANPDVRVIAGLAVHNAEQSESAKRTYAASASEVDGYYLSMVPSFGVGFLQWLHSCSAS